MALGALLVGRWTERVRRPLAAYALAELVLATGGLLFHPVFQGASALFYDILLPGLPEGPGVAAVKWGLAAALILPQAMVLGATFPLMAAGLVRRLPAHAGRSVADVYLWNTLGAAAGILVAGFLILPVAGTVGTLVAAAAGNALAAGIAFRYSRVESPGGERPERAAAPGTGAARQGERARDLWRFLLGIAFLTAFASFQYEVAWIRMLSLVMGSATHSFELMLSAFVLGLALGSWMVRRRVDATRRPLTLLGGIQWVMGAAALATLPAYLGSYEIVAWLLSELPRDGNGYLLFNLARYGLALLVMLPSTVMAGMTLPLITGTLLRAGAGERAVGWVYGVNTLGSVIGVAVAGLVLLPVLGLQGLLTAGAGLDMTLGVAILLWAGLRTKTASAARGVGRRRPRLLGWSAAAAVGTLVVVATTTVGVRLDRNLLTSGIFRHGYVPEPGDRNVLYYRDGRTASVSVHRSSSGLTVLSTNGKPDASLPEEWIYGRGDIASGGETGRVQTPVQATDVAPQTLGPLVLLAHAGGARRGVNIGHGSGMSAHTLLGSSTLESLVTVEIEPLMVEASRLFLPANEGPFRDPRHTFVYGDARSFLARGDSRWDIVFSEPSNPWVSGVASLFTAEYYERVGERLSEGGVYGQWLQLYEIDDDLVLSVLRALDGAFDDYRAYLIGSADLLVVASHGSALPEPDWTLLDEPGVRETIGPMPPLHPRHFDLLRAFDAEDVRPLLARSPTPVNSDFDPVLDMGAERTRFLDSSAEGVAGLAPGNRVDLIRMLRRERRTRGPFRPVPIWDLEPWRVEALASWLGSTERGQGLRPPPYAPWRSYLQARVSFLERLQGPAPADWTAWTWDFSALTESLHGGTAGWADAGLFSPTFTYLERHGGPAAARAVVEFYHGLATWNFEETARAAGVLLPLEPSRRALYPDVLMDGAVVANLEIGRPAPAAEILRELEPISGRDASNVRTRLLEALILDALGGGP